MESNNYKLKLKLVFDKFLENRYELDKYCADNLLRYLENTSDDDTCKLLVSPYFSDLILYTISNIEKTSESVKIFIMHLLTLIMRDELQFTKLLHSEAIYILSERKIINQQNIACTEFMHAYLKQLTALLQHTSGLYWNIKNKIWYQIFNVCHENPPRHIMKACYAFLRNYIQKLNEIDDEQNLTIALGTIVKPILQSHYNDKGNITPDIEKSIIAQVKPSILILLAILDTKDIQQINKAVQLLSQYFFIEPHLFLIAEVTRDIEFAALSTELSFVYTCSMSALGIKIVNQNLHENMISTEGMNYFNMLHVLIHKGMISSIVDFSIKCLLLWPKYEQLCGASMFQRYGRTFNVHIQLMIILLVPFGRFVENMNPFIEDPKCEDGFTLYFLKILGITAEHIIKICFLFRILLDESFTKDIVIQTARQITRLKGHLNNEQASLLFQALFYVLKYFNKIDESGALLLNEMKIESIEDQTILSLVMDNIQMILNEHDINWYNSCEVVCLYNVLMNLLKPRTLPRKLVMKTLDLINVTVKKFLSPDLALLMESKSGSALTEIGETIKMYLQDSEWEVRESAMQLLLTCTELSFVKYTPFQKLISANNLITDASFAVCADTEIYVQSTALKCLSAASRLEGIWKDMLNFVPCLYDKLTSIVQNHSEGIVRKEAVIALTEIFSNQKVTAEFKNLMYKVMYHVALNDLHWEVQLAALKFWRKAIQFQLSLRGMIDGKFPSVTFSREKRKIVTLNDKEINRQLISILNELSLIGCLSVLKTCMNEDYNIKVIEQTYTVANELLDILNKYNFKRFPEITLDNALLEHNDVVMDMDYSPMDLSLPAFDCNRDNKRDEVINLILNMTQSQLMEDLHNRTQIKMQEDDNDNQLTNVSVIDPNMFLDTFRNMDYLNLIEKKRNWGLGVRDLNYYLDEILLLDNAPSDLGVGCH